MSARVHIGKSEGVASSSCVGPTVPGSWRWEAGGCVGVYHQVVRRLPYTFFLILVFGTHRFQICGPSADVMFDARWPAQCCFPLFRQLYFSLRVAIWNYHWSCGPTTRAALHLIVVIYRGVDKKSWLIKNWTELFVLIRFLCVFLYLKNWINNIIKIIKLVGLVFGLKKKLKNRTEYQINRITIRQIPKV